MAVLNEECMQCPAYAKCVAVRYGSKRCIMTRWSYDINGNPKPITNAERIRSMSDEELAKEMCHRSIDAICDIVCGGDCKAIETLNRTSKEVCRDIILAWLHRPVEEEK